VLNSSAEHRDPPIVRTKALVINVSPSIGEFSALVENTCAKVGMTLWILWIIRAEPAVAGQLHTHFNPSGGEDAVRAEPGAAVAAEIFAAHLLQLVQRRSKRLTE